MRIRLIGVDCSTDRAKMGFALGEYENGLCRLLSVAKGSSKVDPATTISEWIVPGRVTLIAFDSPLGWPESFATKLLGHKAGECVAVNTHEFFNRETDREVHRLVKQKPLDIGADLIARTAIATLNLLHSVRGMTRQKIPLCWSFEMKDKVSAIEVYPAATLKSHDIPNKKYKEKEPEHGANRKKIVARLRKQIDFDVDSSVILDKPHVLDSVVCVLAASDFLRGDVIQPSDGERAKGEGWIWVKQP